MFGSVHHPPHHFQVNINSETLFRAASAGFFFQCCFEVLTTTLSLLICLIFTCLEVASGNMN
jgi:hypothetical protein